MIRKKKRGIDRSGEQKLINACLRLARLSMLFAILFMISNLVSLKGRRDFLFDGGPIHLSSANIPSRLIRQLTQPNVTDHSFLIATGEDCECDLISVDCLDSIRCLPDPYTTHQFIALGVATRQLLKEVTSFKGETQPYLWQPWGKGTQSFAALGWKSWIRYNALPKQLKPQASYLFVNASWYEDCVQQNLNGAACFLGDFQTREDLGYLEKEAFERVKGYATNETTAALKRDLLSYQMRANANDPHLPALGHLLAFSHICRILFHRRQFLRDIYDQRLISTINDDSDERLRVSLHIRRADACDHKRTGHSEMPSPLNSSGQPSSDLRICYSTSVYMKALRRVKNLTSKPLDVYLATDDAGVLLNEIQRDHEDLYNSSNWHIMNYPRDSFVYDAWIEKGDNDRNKQALLGESAVSDLFHLSHGQVFVGHLGSRFGKVAYLLTTARHNTFVPFFSVDGHSYCCEVDEPCGEMKPYIPDMRDCLTFMHENTLGVYPMNKDYWEVGSLKRKVARERERQGLRVFRTF